MSDGYIIPVVEVPLPADDPIAEVLPAPHPRLTREVRVVAVGSLNPVKVGAVRAVMVPLAPIRERDLHHRNHVAVAHARQARANARRRQRLAGKAFHRGSRGWARMGADGRGWTRMDADGRGCS